VKTVKKLFNLPWFILNFFLKRYLDDKLPPEDLDKVSKSYDIVGEIAIIKVPPPLESRIELIAEAVMEANKAVNTVLNQKEPITGKFRLRQLEHVLGERKTVTLYREYGCVFKVDLGKAYFSPRLSYERMRVGKLVGRGEVVLNMFAGVGCFSIIIAKHSPARRIYSIDLNPEAVRLMRANISLNRVRLWVEALDGDAKDVIEERFLNRVDRVLMPLPAKAYEYLDIAVKALKDGRGVIHYYDFVHAGRGEKPIRKLVEKVSDKLNGLGVEWAVAASRVVRTVGPNWYQVVLDINIRP
jgi:tRNA (guanine37-N1)-methyltransferase